jgi:hypothetical protein
MKKLVVAFAALVIAAPVVSAAQDVAPAVKRKPAATTTAPAAAGQGAAATPTAAAVPQQSARPGNERDYVAALTAAGGDSALDTSLIRVMGRLFAAGRCREAVSLAVRDGRRELAARAQQLCK